MVIRGHGRDARVAGHRGASKLIEGVIRIGDGIAVRVGLGKDVSGKIVGRRKDRLLGGGRVFPDGLSNDISGQIVFGARKGAFDVFGQDQAAERVVGVGPPARKAPRAGFLCLREIFSFQGASPCNILATINYCCMPLQRLVKICPAISVCSIFQL